MNYLVTKGTSEVYNFKFPGKSYWATFTIDCPQGLFSVTSDFGDYSYIWRSPGKPFKEFLIDLNEDYLLSKLGKMDFFNKPATIKNLKRDILKVRRYHDISDDDARTLWDKLDFANDTPWDTANSLVYWLSTETKLGELIYEDDCSQLPIVIEYDPSLKAFVKNIWPAFIDALKQEVL